MRRENVLHSLSEIQEGRKDSDKNEGDFDDSGKGQDSLPPERPRDSAVVFFSEKWSCMRAVVN